MTKKTSNNVKPAISGKLKMPPGYSDTYGVKGTGEGGGSSPAKNGGNNTTPAIANKIPLPPNFDKTYNPPVK